MTTETFSIYDDLSVAGLTGELHERMISLRPSISRNTIRLAFVAGATTPLRKRIIEEGKKLLETPREGQNEAAATTAAQR